MSAHLDCQSSAAAIEKSHAPRRGQCHRPSPPTRAVGERPDEGMRGLMSHKVGVWIDHERAVIVSASQSGVTTMTLESEVEAHPRYSGQQDGGGEKKYEERHGQQLDRYYDDVISLLGLPDAIL